MAVDSWLTTTFAPDFEARASRFAELCAQVELELAGAWQTLSSSLTDMRADHFDAFLAGAASADAGTPHFLRRHPVRWHSRRRRAGQGTPATDPAHRTGR